MLAYVEDSSRFTHYKITNFIEKQKKKYTNCLILFIISIYRITFTSVDMYIVDSSETIRTSFSIIPMKKTKLK